MVLLLVLALAMLAAACSRGAYPVDVFPELHYQESYRSQEPPRLPPPPDAVPVTGREVAYTFSQAAELINPFPKTDEALAQGAEVFRVECSFCHGPAGRGDGVMADYFRQAGVTPPVDFASQRVRSRKNGELYWFLTNGLGNMPSFSHLLAPEKRWLLVQFIRSVAEGQEAK